MGTSASATLALQGIVVKLGTAIREGKSVHLMISAVLTAVLKNMDTLCVLTFVNKRESCVPVTRSAVLKAVPINMEETCTVKTKHVYTKKVLLHKKNKHTLLLTMAGEGIELVEIAGVADDLENLGASGATGVSGAAMEEAISARMGQDNGFVKIDGEGNVTVDGEIVKSPEALRDVLNKLPPEKLQMVRDAFKDPEKANPTPEVREKATKLGQENNQTGVLGEAFSKLSGALEDKFNKIMENLKKSNGSFMEKVLKYTTLAGGSYALLSAMATGKTGCYGVYGNQQQMVYKQATGSADCVFFSGTAPNPPGDAALVPLVPGLCNANACNYFIQGSTAATLSQLTKDSQTSSCNCVDSNGNLVSPNVTLSYQKPTAWDVLGGIVNGVGGYITKLADGTLQVLEAAADAVGDLPKILMYAGIGIAVILLIVGLAFLGKKLSDKKKLKGGCWKKGYKSDYKVWKKSMKQIQNHTPLEHLTMAQSLF
jgi:hypothetical protein